MEWNEDNRYILVDKSINERQTLEVFQWQRSTYPLMSGPMTGPMNGDIV